MKNTEKVFSIQLKGALDGNSSLDLYEYVVTQLGEGYTKFIFSMQSVDYITSHGIAFFLKVQKTFSESGNKYFSLYGLKDEVQSVLGLLGLIQKLPIASTLEEAEVYLQRMEESAISEPQPKPEGKKVQFYFSGSPRSGNNPLPVSELKPVMSPRPNLRIDTSSENQIEDKISQLKQEMKETISLELEKKMQALRKGGKVTFPDLPQSKAAANEEANLPKRILPKSMATPLNFERIFPCEACNTTLRAVRVGKHQCPHCGTEVFVGRDGVLRFLEKLAN